MASTIGLAPTGPVSKPLGFALSFSKIRIGLVLVAAALCMPLAQSIAVADESISAAETLLFDTDHLKTITQPLSLHYHFKKTGKLEGGFEDDVELTIRSGPYAGRKQVSTTYLSGEHRENFPPVEGATGNPVLMYFLERDIREMQRLTGGNWRYFQKRIRLALADKAQIKSVDFLHEGKQVTGQEVRIVPYADDPLRKRYDKYAEKYYLFVLSEAVPGGVYQISAVIPDPKSTSAPDLMEETLTLIRAGGG